MTEDNVISFDRMKFERDADEIDAHQLHWERVRDQLATNMTQSGLNPKGTLKSAVLSALVAVIRDDDESLSLEDVKAQIKAALAPFWEVIDGKIVGWENLNEGDESDV